MNGSKTTSEEISNSRIWALNRMATYKRDASPVTGEESDTDTSFIDDTIAEEMEALEQCPNTEPSSNRRKIWCFTSWDKSEDPTGATAKQLEYVARQLVRENTAKSIIYYMISGVHETRHSGNRTRDGKPVKHYYGLVWYNNPHQTAAQFHSKWTKPFLPQSGRKHGVIPLVLLQLLQEARVLHLPTQCP